MDLLIYVLSLCISFSGLMIGMNLSNIALEEIKAVSTYLKYINILLISAIFFIATYNTHLIYSMIVALLIAVALIIFRDRYSSTWIYASMGALFYIAVINNEMINAAILIFIYGMSISTIYIAENLKKGHDRNNKKSVVSKKILMVKDIISRHLPFLIIGIIFYMIPMIIRNI